MPPTTKSPKKIVRAIGHSTWKTEGSSSLPSSPYLVSVGLMSGFMSTERIKSILRSSCPSEAQLSFVIIVPETQCRASWSLKGFNLVLWFCLEYEGCVYGKGTNHANQLKIIRLIS